MKRHRAWGRRLDIGVVHVFCMLAGLAVGVSPTPAAGPAPPSPPRNVSWQPVALSNLESAFLESACAMPGRVCLDGLSWVIDLEPFPLTSAATAESGAWGSRRCVGGQATGCSWATVGDYLASGESDTWSYKPLELVITTVDVSQAFQMGHTATGAAILSQLLSLRIGCSDPVPVYAPFLLQPLLLAIAGAIIDPGVNATAAAEAAPSPLDNATVTLPDGSLVPVTRTDAGVYFSRLYYPYTIVRQPQLRRLVINSCALTGQLPGASAWLQLPLLEHLDLSRNMLSGPLPSTFGEAPPLALVNLSRNALSGPLTDGLARYGGCGRVLDLSRNNLRGHVPATWLDSACALEGKDPATGLTPRRTSTTVSSAAASGTPISASSSNATGGNSISSSSSGGGGSGSGLSEVLRQALGLGGAASGSVVIRGAVVQIDDSGAADDSLGSSCPVDGVAWSVSAAASVLTTLPPAAANASDSGPALLLTPFPFSVLLYGNPLLGTAYGGDRVAYAVGFGDSVEFSMQLNACTSFEPLVHLLWLWGTFAAVGVLLVFTSILHGLVMLQRMRTTRKVAPEGGSRASGGQGAAARERAQNPVRYAGGGGDGGGGNGFARSRSQERAHSGAAAAPPGSSGGTVGGSTGGVTVDSSHAGVAEAPSASSAPGSRAVSRAPSRAVSRAVSRADVANASAMPGTQGPLEASGAPPGVQPEAGAHGGAVGAASRGAVPVVESTSAPDQAPFTPRQASGWLPAAPPSDHQPPSRPEVGPPLSASPGAPSPPAQAPSSPRPASSSTPRRMSVPALARVVVIAHARYSRRAAQHLTALGDRTGSFLRTAVNLVVHRPPWGPVARSVTAIAVHAGAGGLTYVLALPERRSYCSSKVPCLPYAFVAPAVMAVTALGVTLFLFRAVKELAGTMAEQVQAAVAEKLGQQQQQQDGGARAVGAAAPLMGDAGRHDGTSGIRAGGGSAAPPGGQAASFTPASVGAGAESEDSEEEEEEVGNDPRRVLFREPSMAVVAAVAGRVEPVRAGSAQSTGHGQGRPEQHYSPRQQRGQQGQLGGQEHGHFRLSASGSAAQQLLSESCRLAAAAVGGSASFVSSGSGSGAAALAAAVNGRARERRVGAGLRDRPVLAAAVSSPSAAASAATPTPNASASAPIPRSPTRAPIAAPAMRASGASGPSSPAAPAHESGAHWTSGQEPVRSGSVVGRQVSHVLPAAPSSPARPLAGGPRWGLGADGGGGAGMTAASPTASAGLSPKRDRREVALSVGGSPRSPASAAAAGAVAPSSGGSGFGGTRLGRERPSPLSMTLLAASAGVVASIGSPLASGTGMLPPAVPPPPAADQLHSPGLLRRKTSVSVSVGGSPTRAFTAAAGGVAASSSGYVPTAGGGGSATPTASPKTIRPGRSAFFDPRSLSTAAQASPRGEATAVSPPLPVLAAPGALHGVPKAGRRGAVRQASRAGPVGESAETQHEEEHGARGSPVGRPTGPWRWWPGLGALLGKGAGGAGDVSLEASCDSPSTLHGSYGAAGKLPTGRDVTSVDGDGVRSIGNGAVLLLPPAYCSGGGDGVGVGGGPVGPTPAKLLLTFSGSHSSGADDQPCKQYTVDEQLCTDALETQVYLAGMDVGVHVDARGAGLARGLAHSRSRSQSELGRVPPVMCTTGCAGGGGGHHDARCAKADLSACAIEQFWDGCTPPQHEVQHDGISWYSGAVAEARVPSMAPAPAPSDPSRTPSVRSLQRQALSLGAAPRHSAPLQAVQGPAGGLMQPQRVQELLGRAHRHLPALQLHRPQQPPLLASPQQAAQSPPGPPVAMPGAEASSPAAAVTIGHAGPTSRAPSRLHVQLPPPGSETQPPPSSQPSGPRVYGHSHSHLSAASASLARHVFGHVSFYDQLAPDPRVHSTPSYTTGGGGAATFEPVVRQRSAWLDENLRLLPQSPSRLRTAAATPSPGIGPSASGRGAATHAPPTAAAATANGMAGPHGGSSGGGGSGPAKLRPAALLVVHEYLGDYALGRPGSGAGTRLACFAATVARIAGWSVVSAPLCLLLGPPTAVVLSVRAILAFCLQCFRGSGGSRRSGHAADVAMRDGDRRSGVAAGGERRAPPTAASSRAQPATPGPHSSSSTTTTTSSSPAWLSGLQSDALLFLAIHLHVGGWMLCLPLAAFAAILYGMAAQWGRGAVPYDWVFLAANAAALAGALLLLLDWVCDLPVWEHGVCRYPYVVAVRAARAAAAAGPEGVGGRRRAGGAMAEAVEGGGGRWRAWQLGGGGSSRALRWVGSWGAGGHRINSRV